MKLLVVPGELNFHLESLLAIGVLTFEGVLGDISLLLSLILLGVFRLHMPLQISPPHGTPPDVLIQTDLTFKAVIPQMNVFDVSVKI